MSERFTGFSPETYKFLMELQYFNDKTFFDANRARYLEFVREPMLLLGMELAPAVSAIDPLLVTEPKKALSRIRRDTRYSKNKLPYRDHAWLGYKHPDAHTSEAFCVYFELDTKGYGYGAGMYDANTELMKAVRARMLADPAGFLAIVNDARLSRFEVEGQTYKRDRFPDAPEGLKPYLDRKNLSWCFYSTAQKKTLSASLADEVREGFAALAPIYNYILGK